MLAAAYGLVSSNAKFQTQADQFILEICLSHMNVTPQLFYLYRDKNLVLTVAKIVDGLIMTGLKSDVEMFLRRFDERFKLGTIVHGPGVLRFFGMTIEQFDDYASEIHADDKLNSIECFPLSRVRRIHFDSSLTAVEKSSFMSVNYSLGWLSITVSPLCAFYASHLQQKLSGVTVDAIRSQVNYLRLLKK